MGTASAISIAIAFEEALLVAELVQSTGPIFNLEASNPADIIQTDNIGRLDAANSIFHIVEQYGSRKS